MPNSVRVTAPSRIHFGLLSLEKDAARQFGGAGAMLKEPQLEVDVRVADRDEFVGDLADRLAEFVKLWRDHTGNTTPVRCEVKSAPPEHVGLGLGTQLGLSIARAMDTIAGREVDLTERAVSVGRGRRSAVGTHGFQHGGLIVDDGKQSHESLGQMHERIAIPEDWRVLLVREPGLAGLAGNAEVTAFDSLPPVAVEIRERLRRELYDRMVPAARSGDFESFSESVYQYGHSAGECFAGNQGGPFLTAEIAEFVCFCRERGVPGVGQSSWGPTVFCWFPNQNSVDEFIRSELQNNTNFNLLTTVTEVDNAGAACVIDAE